MREHLPTPLVFQDRAHDHVLRTSKRTRGAFRSSCEYVLANPVRAGLCETSPDYQYGGTVIPGYPLMHTSNADFWDIFWRIYQKTV
jgi:hypothetical protein